MNIDFIEVTENNKYFVIYPKNNMVLIEGNPYKIETDEIQELVRIIRTWKNEYFDDSYLDGNRFEVVVSSNGKKSVMKGIRELPENYDSFSELVRRIYDRR